MTRPRTHLTPAERADLRARLAELRFLKEQVEAEMRRIQLRLARRPKGRTPRKELEHNTESGYGWHHRHKVPFPEDTGGEPCGCREAHRQYIAWVRAGCKPHERQGAV